MALSDPSARVPRNRLLAALPPEDLARIRPWLERVELPAHQTHEFPSMMLGVRRAGMSVAAAVLQKAGLIHYAAGRIENTDRPALEMASCGCYDRVRHEAERLLGPGGSG